MGTWQYGCMGLQGFEDAFFRAGIYGILSVMAPSVRAVRCCNGNADHEPHSSVENDWLCTKSRCWQYHGICCTTCLVSSFLFCNTQFTGDPGAPCGSGTAKSDLYKAFPVFSAADSCEYFCRPVRNIFLMCNNFVCVGKLV